MRSCCGRWGWRIDAAQPAREIVTSPSIQDILSSHHPDTLVHLTNDDKRAFADGVNADTSFARLGDISHLTVPEYQAQVVGSAAAAGPGQPVAGFVLAPPGTPGAFGREPIANYANVPEYVNTRRFFPQAYVPLPREKSEWRT